MLYSFQKDSIIRMYEHGRSCQKIARRIGCAIATVTEVIRGAGLKIRMDRSRPEYLPTPEEIEERAEQIRQEWDEQTHRERAGYGSNSRHWTPPVVDSPETIYGRHSTTNEPT